MATYSAGMRSRLGFSTAIMTRVDILLIDEILSVGDAAFRKKARSLMEDRLTGEQTVVLVSHQEDQVASLCDTAAWIDAGRIRAHGAVDDVLAAYGAA